MKTCIITSRYTFQIINAYISLINDQHYSIFAGQKNIRQIVIADYSLLHICYKIVTIKQTRSAKILRTPYLTVHLKCQVLIKYVRIRHFN